MLRWQWKLLNMHNLKYANKDLDGSAYSTLEYHCQYDMPYTYKTQI